MVAVSRCGVAVLIRAYRARRGGARDGRIETRVYEDTLGMTAVAAGTKAQRGVITVGRWASGDSGDEVWCVCREICVVANSSYVIRVCVHILRFTTLARTGRFA